MKNVIYLVLLTSVFFLIGNSNFNPDLQKYRYTVKVKYQKARSGPDMEYIYYPLPKTNDYQIVSNFHTPGGKIFDNENSVEKYIRYKITQDMLPAEGEWREVILQFDCIPTNSEYSKANIGEIVEYDKTTELYKRYTSKYYDFIDPMNEEIREISDEIWSGSDNYYDFAERCYEYVLDNYSFKMIQTDNTWQSIEWILENNGGDCGDLAQIFINLMRSKGVPARFVVTRGHAWAEFYLEKYGWLPVDPTLNSFGYVSSAYGLIRSNEILYFLKTSESNHFEEDGLNKNHIFFPSHNPYNCDVEIIRTKIN